MTVRPSSRRRAVLGVAGSRVAFVVSSYAVHFGMAHLLSSQEYGRLGVILSFVTLFRTVLSTGMPQTVVRYLAAGGGIGVWRRAMAIQLVAATGLMAGYLVVGPWWALVLGDRALVRPLLLSAPMIVLMAWHQMNLAYHGGRQRFGLQSWTVVLYSGLRAGLALGIVAIGGGLLGGVLGLVLAAGIAAVWTFAQTPSERGTSSVSMAELLGFSAPLLVIAMANGALANLDILMLNTFYPGSASVGYYNGAMNIGKAPYLVFVSFSVTLLPAMAQACTEQGPLAARRLVRTYSSWLAIGCAPLVVVTVMAAPEVLGLLFASEFVVGASALQLLIVSMCGLSLLMLLVAAMVGIGKPGHAMIVTLLTVPTQVAAGWILIPRHALAGAALANLIGVGAGLAAATILVSKHLGMPYDMPRLARVAATLLPIPLVWWAMGPPAGSWLAPAAGVVGALYVALLVAFRVVPPAAFAVRLPKQRRPCPNPPCRGEN